MNRLITTDTTLPGTRVDPRYPDSDGRFMGATAFHSNARLNIWTSLEFHFRHDPSIIATSNLVWYYKEGDARCHRDPDVLVAKGVRGNHLRRSFRAWEEKVVPSVLFEIVSMRSWQTDIGEKRDLYARLGVKEYFVFDAEERYLDPVLQGFKWVKGKPVPLKAAADGSLMSKQLGMRLVREGYKLRLIEWPTGEYVWTPSELVAQAEQRAAKKQEAEEVRQRIKTMTAEITRLRALLGLSPPFPRLRHAIARNP